MASTEREGMGLLRVDKRQARRGFARAAGRYDEVAVLQQEIGRRMIERLGFMKIAPLRILDLGCGTGYSIDALLKLYPKAELIALDIAEPMLRRARRRGRWLKRPRCLCADLDAVPLADGSIDLVFANAALQWSADPPQAFADLARVLRPGGLLIFTSFGPDTLRELRSAWADVDGAEHVHGFIDMHDYGDMLVAAGLADPVMDVERMTLTYTDAMDLMREVKAIGAANAGMQRRRGLLGRGQLAQVCAAYERFRDSGGRLPASYEVVHGHAWVPLQRSIDGETRVAIDVLKRGRR
jgi:malonyl-CoA O-methyltransferase